MCVRKGSEEVNLERYKNVRVTKPLISSIYLYLHLLPVAVPFHLDRRRIAAITDHKHHTIKMHYNDELIQIKNFQQYIDLYIGKKGTNIDNESKRVYEQTDDRWEYAVSLSSTHQFEQISFVNGICTFKGGKHVDYIMGLISSINLYFNLGSSEVAQVN